MHERHRDDLSLIGSQFLHPQRLHRRELAVNFHLGKLADREVQITDLFRDEQHTLDDGRQIEETHLVVTPEETDETRRAGGHPLKGTPVGAVILAHNTVKRK
jgi:hypothetical protein